MIHRLVRRFHDSRTETIWLTIYADLITNLVLVFLALYGLTIMGDDALTRAIHSMKLEDLARLDETPGPLEFTDVVPRIKTRLGQKPHFSVSDNADVIRVEFGEAILFEPGQAILKESVYPLFKELAPVLKEAPYTVVIEGHTDSLPIKGGRFKDNWELSLARSMSVIGLLAKEKWLPMDQMAAAAYGEHRPRASNLTKAGQRMNRRIEIALFRDFPYQGKKNGF